MDFYGRGPLRVIRQRRRENTFGPERGGIRKGQITPPETQLVPVPAQVVGIL